MPNPFPRTTSRLDTDSRRASGIVLALALAFSVAWGAWFLLSDVAVYSVSAHARLEVASAPFPVEAPVAGRVVSTTLAVGRAVKVGEVLVELDVRAQTLGVYEEKARLSGLGPQIARLQAEIAEQENSRRAAQAASQATKAEANASYEEAAAAAALAVDHETRTATLTAQGVIGRADLTRAQSEAKQKRAAAEALRLAADRIDAQQRQKDTEHQVEIERLRRQVASLRAAITTGSATVERLQHEGELRRITAPADGVLAEVAPLRLGGVLQPGAAVATVVPAGALQVVAGFLPADASGRVRPGQPARLRLEGFPPTQYGNVHATVSTVATEVRNGRIRVELTLSDRPTAVPMQHGLPGRVEVEVERVSPARLVLRAAGQTLHPPSTTQANAARP